MAATVDSYGVPWFEYCPEQRNVLSLSPTSSVGKASGVIFFSG